MTIKEFADKYSVPLCRVKAAMRLRKFLTVNEANKDFDEEEIKEEVLYYLSYDVMTCIERMHADKEQMVRIAEGRKNSNSDNEKDGV